jgi:hypothetical protein
MERLSAFLVRRPHELFSPSRNYTRNPPLAKGDKGGVKANTEVFMILKISPHPSLRKRGRKSLFQDVSREISEESFF